MESAETGDYDSTHQDFRPTGPRPRVTVSYQASERQESLSKQIVCIAQEYFVYRELLQQFALRDIRVRYKQAVMGFGWALFMPILIVLSGLIVRYAMAELSGTDLSRGDLAGIAVKALPWSFFASSIGFANGVLIGNSNLVTKIYFPREVLPIGSVAAQAFDSAIGLLALAVVMPFLGAQLSAALLWVPVLLLMLIAITSAAALFLSAANLFFRDVKYIVQVVLTFGIFFTPVFFEPVMFGPTGSWIIMLNPLTPVLEGLRLAIVEGNGLWQTTIDANGALEWSPWVLIYGGTWAVFGLLGASILFHRLERYFAEYV
jgi:lipopolysaccharide transport system permease protein